MMGDDIPQWAKERACELANAVQTTYGASKWAPENVGAFDSITAFARYIMEHEEPPVDPLLIEAARKFLDYQLDKQDCVLTPVEYYRALGNLVAAIPPFERPKFHHNEEQSK